MTDQARVTISYKASKSNEEFAEEIAALMPHLLPEADVTLESQPRWWHRLLGQG